MIVMTLFSTKGGPGKSTTAANLAGILADMGVAVCIIDADEQPTASRHYDLSFKAQKGLQEFLFNSDQIDENMISSTNIENLDIICSNNITSDIRHKLIELPYYPFIFKRNLQHPIFSRYQVIIIDTQGAVGPVQMSAAYASDILLSPVRPEVLSAREFLSGTRSVLKTLDDGSAMTGLQRPELLAFINALDRTRDARFNKELIQEAIASFGVQERVRLMRTVIPESKAYKEAASECIPVHRHEYNPHEKKSETAYETMHRFVYELFSNFGAANVKADWGNQEANRFWKDAEIKIFPESAETSEELA